MTPSLTNPLRTNKHRRCSVFEIQRYYPRDPKGLIGSRLSYLGISIAEKMTLLHGAGGCLESLLPDYDGLASGAASRFLLQMAQVPDKFDYAVYIKYLLRWPAWGWVVVCLYLYLEHEVVFFLKRYSKSGSLPRSCSFRYLSRSS